MIRRISIPATGLAMFLLICGLLYRHSILQPKEGASVGVPSKAAPPGDTCRLGLPAEAQQYVTENPAAAYDWSLASSPFLTLGGEATLNFGSRKVTFVVEKIDTKGANHFVVTGRSIDNPNAAKDVVVAYNNGKMLANYFSGQGIYVIAPSGREAGEWVVGKAAAPAPCGSCSHESTATAPSSQVLMLPNGLKAQASMGVTSTTGATTANASGSAGNTPDAYDTPIDSSRFHTISGSGPVIDVLLYLDKDLVDVLGADQTALVADQCEASFNCAAENSQMVTRVRIPGTKTITAPWRTLGDSTSPTISVAALAIANQNGGFENMASDTKLAGADLAFFMGAFSTRNVASGMGVGTYTFDAAGNAIAFNGGDAVAQYYSFPGVLFTHELGHQLYLNHERSTYTATNTPMVDAARDYNYAWSETGGETGPNGVATVMTGIGGARLYFSNPNVTFTEKWYAGGGDSSNPANWRTMDHQMGRPIGTADAAYDAKFVDEAIAPLVSQLNPALTATTKTGHFVGLSTRSFIGNGDNAMIGGFVIEGSTPKKVMIRAVGPSLTAQGVTGVCPNPQLTLHQYVNGAFQLYATNLDWGTDVSASELATTAYKPGSALEPGLIRTLPAGPYSVVVQPQEGTEGIGMVEVYELADNGDATMVDVSTRALVKSGNDATYGGFIVDCPAGQTKSVLVRGIGPSLTAQGVSGALTDPVITVYNYNNGTPVQIASSDNWATEDTACRVATSGYVPSSPREAATVLDLPAGAYSVKLEPKTGTAAGVGMVEVYQQDDKPAPSMQALPAGTYQ